jgi:hypothetical protein
MCWYSRSYKKLVRLVPCLLLLAASLQSCKPDLSEAGSKAKFFDLKGYFEADSARLTRLNPWVTKSVKHNTETETKKVQITNWGNELKLFTESDINKQSWKESYDVQSTGDFLIYKAKDPGLRTREVLIKKEGSKVKWILIFNHTKNILYENVEKLSYYPDSLYLIQKLQRVRLLGTQKYTIKGVF